MPSISYIPNIADYPDIQKAKLCGHLVLFVGAGASVPSGAPTWSRFAENILEQLTTGDAPQITHATKELLLRNPSPRMTISIASQIARGAGRQIDYVAALNQKEPKLSDIHRLLWKISDQIITTNYDRLFELNKPTGTPVVPSENSEQEQKLKESITPYFRAEDLLIANLKPGTVMHIHASLDDPMQMVLSTANYLERYAVSYNEEKPYLTFLSDLFLNKCVLFVGYSLAELEILEYVFLKRNAADSSSGLVRNYNHYMLQGFFSFEEDLVSHIDKYYEAQCNVKLIPYLRDRNNHDQLKIVLEKWSNEIASNSAAKLARLETLERLLDD